MDILPYITAMAQIILIDLSMSGENAIVVGIAAAGLPTKQRHRAVMVGIAAATVLRIVFALFAVQLLHIVGLTLAGGFLLLWVCWKMYGELRRAQHHHANSHEQGDTAPAQALAKHKTLKDAILQIVVADVSMSLDNVLAVAGAARDHMWILIGGLSLSVLLMGVASTFVVKLLHRYRWIGYAGLAVVLYVAVKMVGDGWSEVAGVI